MECKFKTTYETYEKDFKAALGKNVLKNGNVGTVHLTITCHKDFQPGHIIEIMEFTKEFFNIEKDENLDEGIINDETLKNNEIEIMLTV